MVESAPHYVSDMEAGADRSFNSRIKTILAYAVMLAATVAAFLWIRRWGEGLTAPVPLPGEPTFGSSSNAATVDVLLHVLLALVVVILAARLVGTVFSWIGQPPVIGEVVAGIMLGPSLLGRVWPAATQFILPETVAPFLQTVAQVGVILYMFIVGMELDTRRLRQDTHTTVAVSHASIIAPFVLGSLLALWLYPRLSSEDVPFTIFALFLGVSMSVTAFPVLARILTDRGLQRTPLGVTALSCAAVDDATAWCLLAFVTGVAKARAGSAVYTVVLTLGFIAVMIVVVRPVFSRLADRAERMGRLSQGLTAVIILAMLLSALITEWIGIHALFGAFLLGALVPHDSLLARELTRRLDNVLHQAAEVLVKSQAL